MKKIWRIPSTLQQTFSARWIGMNGGICNLTIKNCLNHSFVL